MRGLLAGLAMALVPGSAVALSCEEYSIESAYWYHARQEASYVLALGAFGELTLIERVATRDTGDDYQAGVTVYSARFEGFTASRRAFDQPFEAEVRLVFPDFSIFGGGHDSAAAAESLAGITGLVWLQKTEAGYQLTADLCAPQIDGDPASVKPALRCLRGGSCPGG